MKREAQPMLSADGQLELEQYTQVLHHREDLSPVINRNYLSDLRQFIAWCEGFWSDGQEDRFFTPQAVAPSLLIRYREYLQTTHDLKPATVNRTLMSSKRYFAWTKKTQLVQFDPASPIKFVPKEASPPRHLNNKDLMPVTHPVAQRLYQRRKEGDLPKSRTDGYRVGLAVEGGGMRVIVSGAMMATLMDQELERSFEAVYSYSSRAFNCVYFLACLGWYALSMYYNNLLGRAFLDVCRMLRGQPTMSLDYVVDVVLETAKPLNYVTVLASPIELYIVASSIRGLKPRDFTRFASKEDFKMVPKASACIPLAVDTSMAYDGDLLLDGGVLLAHPVLTVLEDNCTPNPAKGCLTPVGDKDGTACLLLSLFFERKLGERSAQTTHSCAIVITHGRQASSSGVCCIHILVIQTCVNRRFRVALLARQHLMVGYLQHIRSGLGTAYLDTVKRYWQLWRHLQEVRAQDQQPFILEVACPDEAHHVTHFSQNRNALLQGLHAGYHAMIEAIDGEDCPDHLNLRPTLFTHPPLITSRPQVLDFFEEIRMSRSVQG